MDIFIILIILHALLNIKVLTPAMAKLNIDGPAERQDVPKSKLDEHFLPVKSQPPHQGLPFFPDLHTELVEQIWRDLFESQETTLVLPHAFS